MHNGPATQSAQSETCNTGGVATGGLTGIDFFVLDYKVIASFNWDQFSVFSLGSWLDPS